MTPTYTRYADHSTKCRELTTGHAPYYQEVQRLIKKHMDKEHLRTLIETYTLIALNASGAKDEERAQKLARVTAIAVLADMEASISEELKDKE
jgi:hypothetical protein